MSSLYRPELCWTALDAPDAPAAITVLGAALEELGLVHASFTAAVLEREVSSPTGLPLAGRKVAVPHADPEHVITPAVAVCTLARPVQFGEMGNPQSQLDVEVIMLLALRDRETVQQQLVHLVETFQQPDFVDRLCAAPSPAALFRLMCSGETE